MKKKNDIIFTAMLMMLILSACGFDAGKETGGDYAQPAEKRNIMEEDQSVEKQKQPEETPDPTTEIPEPSEEAEQNKETEQSEDELVYMDGEQEREENQSDNKPQTWQEAYLEIIYHLQDYLVPIYAPDGTNSRSDDDPMNLQIYLGLHDFDADGTLELIAGDLRTLAVFSYKDNEIIKIADLYNPYDALWCINGVYFKENSVSAGCSGSGGTDWVSFGFLNGEYVLGVYNEICPDYGITINGEKGTWEEMNEIYTLDYDQREEERRERIRLVNENGIWMLKYQSGEEAVLDTSFNFDSILW